MSGYAQFSTRENIEYIGLLNGKLKDNHFVVDLIDASDGGSVPEDPIIMDLDGLDVNNLDRIRLRRCRDFFMLLEIGKELNFFKYEPKFSKYEPKEGF